MQNPEVARPRGRPQGATNIRRQAAFEDSTSREPSQFERVIGESALVDEIVPVEIERVLHRANPALERRQRRGRSRGQGRGRLRSQGRGRPRGQGRGTGRGGRNNQDNQDVRDNQINQNAEVGQNLPDIENLGHNTADERRQSPE